MELLNWDGTFSFFLIIAIHYIIHTVNGDDSLKVSLISTGSALPEKVLDNTEISTMVETSDQWITERTGIKTRRVVTTETTISLAVEASKRAMEKAGVAPSDIDLVICATITPDTVVPSAACRIRHELGIDKGAAFDVNAACSGFIYSVSLARSLMLTEDYNTALIVGSEVLSRIVDWTDRTTCILFGDGAGAAILKKDSDLGGEILATHIESFNDIQNALVCDNYPIETPFYTGYKPEKTKLVMDGQQVFRFAVNAIVDSITAVLKKAGKTADEIKYIVPHQANVRIIDSAANKLKIDKSRFFVNLHKVGNTSSASIPIALDELFDSEKPQKGDLVLIVGFGGGLTAGSALIRY